jgi:DNA-binding NarL/FixJ family response regulator
MNDNRRRVMLADDHALFREALRHMLENSGDFVIVAEAEDAAGTLRGVEEHRPELLVLDLSMPGRSGVDLVARLHADHPGMPILVLTMHAERHYALRVLAAGASGYVNKAGRADVLLKALRRLAGGGRYVSESVADLLTSRLQQPAHTTSHERLSDREFQILQALVEGESVSAIALRLHLSVKTISTHKAHILEKVGCDNLPDLVRYAIANGITSDMPTTR